MGLRLRADKTERCVRSVGDPPNGILMVSATQLPPKFAISASWQPPNREVSDEMEKSLGGAGGVALDAVKMDPDDEDVERLEMSEVIGAIEVGDLATLQLVIYAAQAAFQFAIDLWLPKLGLEPIEGHFRMLHELREELLALGFGGDGVPEEWRRG